MIEEDIAFDVETFEFAGLGIVVNAVAILIEDDVVHDALHSFGVLPIDAMSVPSVRRRALPSVAIDHAAVNFRINRRSPESDPDSVVAHNQVDELDVMPEDADTRRTFMSAI